MQEYNNPQEYHDTLEKMQDTSVFQQRFGQHRFYQNNYWQQYAFDNTKHRPEHWPEDLWEECWQDGYIDFTTDNWVNLSWQQQFQYAKSYQQWYMHYSCLYNVVQTVKEAKLELQLIPPGKFWMGSPEDEENRRGNETRHRVLIDKTFYIGKYPVTQEQWQKVMENNPSDFKKAGLNAPVECVSWNDCMEFCEKVGVELPTEAQWEYACRGGTTSVYNIGNTITPDQVNFDNNSGTTPVGSLPNANSWGCCDFHGNVWEWSNDWYDSYPRDCTKNSIVPHSGSLRVLRGGCWNNSAWVARSACRFRRKPVNICNFAGFRFSLSKVRRRT